MELAVTYTNKQHQVIHTIVNSFPSVSVFWKSAASFIREAAVPSRIEAKSENNGSAFISLRKRGSVKDSLYTQVADETMDLSVSPFSERYLVKGEKAYVLKPVTDEDGSITSFEAVYGSSNAVLTGKGKTVKVPYPISEFWVKYYEKLAKGYKDRSRTISLSAKSIADDETGAQLFRELLEDTKKALPLDVMPRGCRNIDKITLTETQVEKAWKVFRQLKKTKRVKTFRRTYQTLLSLLPKTNLPETDNIDPENATALFQRIDQALSNFENIVASKSTFADRGITIRIADEAEHARILADLPDDIARRVETVYAVHSPAKEKIFADYCARYHITETKELWHGSRNENWLSIIKNGLRLHPNATITGKMFGDGIYFAPEAKKAYGYVSCTGTYWANGCSEYGFMGLFTTAYGTPCHDDKRFYRRNANPQKMLTRMGCGCLHALHDKAGLRHDEVVFYSEKAINLSYIIKIKSR